MRRWAIVGVLVILVLIVAGLILTGIQRKRLDADREACKFRFMQLGQFAAEYSKGTAGLKPNEPAAPELPQAIPPGTVQNLALPPDQRLSWVCDILPYLNQQQQDTAGLGGKLDRTLSWDAPPNREVSVTRLNLFVIPSALPDVPADQPAVTQFVGLSGIGPNSAELPIARSIPARAGCFRYDTPTPLLVLRENDGLSTTFLFIETSNELGPWIRGGFSTVRGLDVSDGAKPPLGRGGQFGGNFPGVFGFGRADGSADFFTDRMNVQVLQAHFTIAGGENEGIPGED